MIDLRDQLADFEAAARRLLVGQPAPAKPRATCHPRRPVEARGLCKPCYSTAWTNGTLHRHPVKHRPRQRLESFADAYELYRDEGSTRDAIAQRLGMSRNGVNQAYRRAVRAGLIAPDRRTA